MIRWIELTKATNVPNASPAKVVVVSPVWTVDLQCPRKFCSRKIETSKTYTMIFDTKLFVRPIPDLCRDCVINRTHKHDVSVTKIGENGGAHEI